jgi:DNA-binding CsgD family transcriptional regulator
MQGINAVTGPQAADLLERAREADLRARREDALELLAGCAEWPAPFGEQALLLRAEILAARDAIAALQELAANADAFTSPDGKVGYLIASARAYMRARNFDTAEAMLESAEKALSGASEGRKNEIAYARARLSWNRREYDPQNENLALAMRSVDPALSFNALNLRAWMHIGLEDYRAAMRDFVECMHVYQKHGYRCGLANVAMTLQPMLGFGWELLDSEVEREAEAAFDTIEWTAEIAVYRFLCLRGLAWYAFLRGDSARAQWLFKDSKDVAPSLAWKVMAHVDRAYVARLNRNEAWAAEELHEAHAIARSLDWHATRDEERAALITLAVLFAPIDLGHAQRYVSTYIELGAHGLNPANEASHDPRRNTAHQKYAAGRVQAMLGNTDLAVRSLQEAYEIFAAIDHDFRAAMVADALHDLTHDARWLETGRVHAAKFPRCAFAERLNNRQARAPGAEVQGLTPTQRQIAIAHCQGLDNDELSRRFSRSTFTIEKQLEGIYAAFGVRSRAGLRDEMHRRGLL